MLYATVNRLPLCYVYFYLIFRLYEKEMSQNCEICKLICISCLDLKSNPIRRLVFKIVIEISALQ